MHVMVHQTLLFLPSIPSLSSISASSWLSPLSLSSISLASLGWLWCHPVTLNLGVQRMVHWLWRQWSISNPSPRSFVLNLKDNTLCGVFVPLTELRLYRVLLDRYLRWYGILTVSKVRWIFFSSFYDSLHSIHACTLAYYSPCFFNHLD